MSDRRGALPALVVGLLVTVAAVVLAVTWARESRPFTAAVPQPPALTEVTVVRVPGDGRACLQGITITSDSQQALFRVGTRGRPGVPLAVELEGPGGYRSTDRIAGDWTDNDLLVADVEPPPRALHGAFCIRNEGRRTIDVYGTKDQARSIGTTLVDDRRQVPNIAVTFTQRRPGTIAGHTDRIADWMSTFRPGFVAPWLLWVLLVLVVVGVPGLVAWTMYAAAREPDPDADVSGS